MRPIVWLILAGSLLAGCTSSEVLVAHSVPLATSTQAVSEAELLDVGILVFDSGVPEGEVDKEVLEKLIREGTFVQIRRTESLYMAVVLQETLRKSGNWGSVWVTPRDTTAADVSVAAKILHSDGDLLRLYVTAKDATGRVWIDDEYEMSTAAGAFNRQRYPELDPYQDVFNRIANDLAAAQGRLTAEQRRNVRTVSGMRYAADLSPEAFSGYVTEEKGVYRLSRLPAADDPMYDRTQRVRQRERLFLDTLDQHYVNFYREAMRPYDGWREYAREEAIEIRELTKSARWRMGMGVATIVASVVYGSNSGNDSFSDRVIRDAMMYIGVDMIRTSQLRKQEKRLHTDTLEELSASFDDEVRPMIVEIQGTQHRLSGTADTQYQEWRDLLRQIYSAESGFVPEDLTIYAEPEVEAPVELPLVPAVEPATETEAPAAPADATTTEAASNASVNLVGGA